jgi:hypothetical protein
VFLEEVTRKRKRKRDILLGTWSVRSLYRAVSFTTAARKLARYKLDLVGMQEVRWDKRGLQFFYGKGNENHQFATGSFVHHRIVSAFQTAEFVGDRLSYIVMRGRWCNIFLNVHATSEEKSDELKDRFDEELEQVFDHFSKYHMKILLGDINAKAGRENIFKPTTGKESIHQDSNDKGVRLVKFAILKNLVVKSTMFPHRNVHT